MQIQTFLLFIASILVLVVSLPLVFKFVPPNRRYGFRTATTLSRTDIWYRSNVFAGVALVVASGLSAIIILFVPQLSVLAHAAILIGSLLVAVVASVVYVKRIA